VSEDLTKRLSPSDKDEILTAIKNLDTRIRSFEARFGSVEVRLGRLEQTVDERLYDTRPMWHRVAADIAELQAGLQRLERGQEDLRAQIRDLSSAIREVSRDQIVINEATRKIQLDFHTIDERLHRLEVNRN
jgi:chromosome segregation ATPase